RASIHSTLDFHAFSVGDFRIIFGSLSRPGLVLTQSQRFHAHETQTAARLAARRSQIPGDFFHLCFGRRSPVFVERALAHPEAYPAFNKEGAAIPPPLGHANPADDVSATAGAAKRLPPSGVPFFTRTVTICFSLLRGARPRFSPDPPATRANA